MTIICHLKFLVVFFTILSYDRVVSFKLETISRFRISTSLNAGFGAPKPVISKSKAPSAEVPCCCGSGSSYGNCCKPYHDGTAPAGDPVLLVRSRFSALSYGLIPYIMATTHPDHKEFVTDEQTSKKKIWEKELYIFSNDYEFVSLTFDQEEVDKAQSEDPATVSFVAKLKKVGSNAPAQNIKEVSKFSKVGGKWLYLDAKVDNPFKNVQGDRIVPQRKAVSTIRKGVPSGN